MSEFEQGADTYRIGKLNAFQQFHLSRKVAPIIPTLIPIFLKLNASGVDVRAQLAASVGSKDAAASPLSGDLGSLAEAMTSFADGIANMPDESAEFILSTCLSVVQRRQGTAWFPVWNAQQNTCMFDDLDLGVLIKLSIRVIKESLGPFLAGMLSGQGTPKA